MPFVASWICQSCSDGDGDDELDVCCNGNAIVEITLQRDYLLLRLQDLVDSETLQDANVAIQAIYDECQSQPNLQRFMVRAGTVPIIHDVIRQHLKQQQPQTSIDDNNTDFIQRLSQFVVAPVSMICLWRCSFAAITSRMYLLMMKRCVVSAYLYYQTIFFFY